LDGKHQFGQGLITYANEDVVNWVTTLADSFRVADDMGKLQLQFSMFHKPLFSWKGSYVVTQVSTFCFTSCYIQEIMHGGLHFTCDVV
jgi:egghead protein (zeste-white 4 protein)